MEQSVPPHGTNRKVPTSWVEGTGFRKGRGLSLMGCDHHTSLQLELIADGQPEGVGFPGVFYFQLDITEIHESDIITDIRNEMLVTIGDASRDGDIEPFETVCIVTLTIFTQSVFHICLHEITELYTSLQCQAW